MLAFGTDNLSGLKLLQQRNNQEKKMICTHRRHFKWTPALNLILNYFITRMKIIFV